jgi:hypothetical protein
MSEYKVAKVSEQEPRRWDGPNGTVFYIKTMLEGHARPVSIGKKSADALKIGDTVYGTITPDPGHPEDKFKAEAKPFSGGGKSNYTPPDTHAIAKSVALKAAVEYFVGPKNATAYESASVLEIADKFLAWLEADDKANTQTNKNEEPHYEEQGF